MCNEAVCIKPYAQQFVSILPFFYLISDHLKTQGMCIKAVEEHPCYLDDAFNHKTQEMCDKGVSEDPYLLPYVPDWFVMQDQKSK